MELNQILDFLKVTTHAIIKSETLTLGHNQKLSRNSRGMPEQVKKAIKKL